MKIIPAYGVQLVRDGSVKAESKTADKPEAVTEIVRAYMGDVDREMFVVLMVNARTEVIGISTVSIGTLSASLVHPRETFKAAILAGAAAIVVCHNHPSGDPTPSAEDRDATRRLKQSGDLLGIPVLDHVIIGFNTFYSFRASGAL